MITTDNAYMIAEYLAQKNHVVLSEIELRRRIYDWYVNTDITDPDILASIAVAAPYDESFSWNDIINCYMNSYSEAARLLEIFY